MRRTWLVTRRELGARWVLVPAAVLVGTLAMLAIRSLDHGSGDADRVIDGTWLATLVIGAIVGMSLLGEELANGRVSFYFTRPFAPSEIYAGKLVAGVALALVIQAAVITLVGVGLPALAWVDSELARRGAMAVIGERVLATFACVTLGIAVSIVLQARSRWVLVDLLCAAVIGVVAIAIVIQLNATRATALQVAALALATLGLAIATWRALTTGRTDRERTHHALSTTLWPIVMPSALLLLATTQL